MPYEIAGYYSVIARVERAITRVIARVERAITGVIARSITLDFVVISFCYDFVTKSRQKSANPSNNKNTLTADK